MHDRPTIAELLDAVRGFLEHDVLAATEGRVQFHARVAANALAVIERELAAGAGPAEAHAARLAALGYPDDASLAAAIRAGDLDDRLAEVRAALLPSIRSKVEVANPKYLE